MMRVSHFVMVAILCAGLLAWAPAAAWAKPATVIVKVRVDNESDGYEGYRAMDGNPATMWHTSWGGGEPKHPHEIVVDLGASRLVSGFGCLPRANAGNGTIKAYECYLGENAKKPGKAVAKGTFPPGEGEKVVQFPEKRKGRYFRLRALSEVNGRPWTSIAELRILSGELAFRAKAAGSTVRSTSQRKPANETEAQYEVLKQDLRSRKRFEQYAGQTYRREALILPADRDPLDVILRRTAALLADIRSMADAPDLSAPAGELDKLRAACEKTDVQNVEAREKLFASACKVRRTIAFANPLLSFDRILFIKRHRSSFNHMCDQYYGINAPAGGGLYELRDAFGAEPKVHNVLAESTVENGRLKGTKLEGGSWLSPDLSFDGKEVLFAYVECTGDRKHTWHTETDKRGYWSIGRSYHVFKVGADGSALTQLTDGTWNDFDGCFLPNGRVAFISERRGGYLRCGRTCPTYTLHDMADDGSDIRRLSPHETNEWHPSVTNEGLIIYTRWDYVDRHGCTAHLPWVTTLDGRDSRAVHGNFAPRRTRPDMEVDIRAIPGSNRYLATAAPHHGQAFGSLVLMDPDIEDDDQMSPVRRITPDVAFPESQGGRQVYGSAWPLSEDYYLAVYDPITAIARNRGRQGRQDWKMFNYGIYLVDAFGNKVLIYRDPSIACMNPIPLRPRPMPATTPQLVKDGPFLPSAAKTVEGRRSRSADATIAVMDVYNGLKAWPDGTSIQALRVVQIVPMSVPSGGPPHEMGLREPSSRDSVVLARYVLGTVPVEADGSVHFRVPANVEVFFQALDANGLAVQSMRSATYAKPGERLVCHGCHDRRHRSPLRPSAVPLALRKDPRNLTPDVEGSNPFSYPRLIQPVLDKRCVPCHTRNAAKKAPDLTAQVAGRGRNVYYASFQSLAKGYGFWDYHHGHRTTPGRFGARASKLYQMLTRGSHAKKVKLSGEELHRIALWLDCCSVFYGVYERDGGKAQLAGKVVDPTLE